MFSAVKSDGLISVFTIYYNRNGAVDFQDSRIDKIFHRVFRQRF